MINAKKNRLGCFMKKILAILLPVSIAATVMATSYADNNDYYVYAERGAQASNDARNDFNAFNFKLGTGLAAPLFKVGDTGVASPLEIPVVGSVGYSHTFNQFYLGGAAEFGWNFEPAKKGYETNGKVSYRQKWQAMATVQVGGVISDTNVIYMDAGYALGDFSYLTNDNSTFNTYYQGGPTVGAGVSLQLSDHVNFDMNYHFVYYLKKTLKDQSDIKVKQNIATVGLSFHF